MPLTTTEAPPWAPNGRQLMYATHGNGPQTETPGRWQTVASRAAEARALQEPQPVGRLRAQGWRVPGGIPDTYPLQVYDTRIDRQWLLALATEVSGVDATATRLIGGDFLTEPHLEDAQALHPELRRWGGDGSGAAHLVVPPRAHQAVWATRCALQMRVEDPATLCTICVLVPREHCMAVGDTNAVRRLLPQLQPLFDDTTLATRVLVVGERAPLLRVPAHTEEKLLPPPRWERALTPVNRALVLVQVRRAGVGVEPLQIGAVRGALPKPGPPDVELLRLEYVLPPALRQQAAERATRKALQQVATKLNLPEPPPHQLRQIQTVHGALVALLGVPRAQACEWLRGSGCGGLYLRPFWTEHTGRDLDRSRFTLLWARGKGARGPELWDAFHNKPGVFGLLASGKDVALRISAEADVAALQAQLGATLNDVAAQFRRPIPGQRWWRLGPLTEAEVWRAGDLVLQTGLVAIGAIRVAAAGPFRKHVYFAAAGTPTCILLDDGSWNGSSAQLQPADPPPRRKPSSGTALPSQSTWAGPRQTTAPLQPQPPTAVPPGRSPFPQPASLLTPSVWASGPPAPRHRTGAALTPQSTWADSSRTSPAVAPRANPLGSVAQPDPLPPQSRSAPPAASRPHAPLVESSADGEEMPRGGPPRRRRHAGRPRASPDEMEEMRALLRELQADLRALRRENELLRRAQVMDPWRQAYPFYPPVAPSAPVTPSRLTPIPLPQFAPMQPVPTIPPAAAADPAPGDAEMLPSGSLGPHSREPGDTPDKKRQPRAARALAVDDSDDV